MVDYFFSEVVREFRTFVCQVCFTMEMDRHVSVRMEYVCQDRIRVPITKNFMPGSGFKKNTFSMEYVFQNGCAN